MRVESLQSALWERIRWNAKHEKNERRKFRSLPSNVVLGNEWHTHTSACFWKKKMPSKWRRKTCFRYVQNALRWHSWDALATLTLWLSSNHKSIAYFLLCSKCIRRVATIMFLSWTRKYSLQNSAKNRRTTTKTKKKKWTNCRWNSSYMAWRECRRRIQLSSEMYSSCTWSVNNDGTHPCKRTDTHTTLCRKEMFRRMSCSKSHHSIEKFWSSSA